jgi:hypothetical protein
VRFLGFFSHDKGALRQEISKWSTVCNTFSRSGWSVVRIESLSKGGTSKKRPSPHLHKVPTRSNKVGPRTFQTALVPTLRPYTFMEYFLGKGTRLPLPFKYKKRTFVIYQLYRIYVIIYIYVIQVMIWNKNCLKKRRWTRTFCQLRQGTGAKKP